VRGTRRTVIAGSTEAGGRRRGLIRRLLAALGVSSSSGSGAPSRRTPLLALGVLVLTIAVVLGAASALAATPTVTIEAATQVGFTTAKGSGEVNPEGKETSYHFEYTSQAQFEGEGFANAAQAGAGTLGAGDPATAVAAVLPGLAAGTTYHLRLVAENEDSAGVPAEALAATFTTQTATAPTLTIEPAGSASFTKAHIAGTVDPEGGNVDPIGPTTVPIAWFLQISRDPINEGWETRGEGTIEGHEAEGSVAIPVGTDLEGLANNAEYKFRLAANYAGQQTISAEGAFTTELVTPPVVTADDATLVTGTTAHFSGTVTTGNADPAFDSTCSFDYVTDPQFQIEEFASAQSIACAPPTVSGATVTAVTADPIGLVPNTVYHLRIRAENQGGQGTAPTAGTFQTEAVAPAIASTFATDVLTTSARLNARINPGGAATTAHFEYVTLPLFLASGGTFAGASRTPESNSIGSDNSAHDVGAPITQLEASTAYRFRVVTTNAVSPGGTPGPATEFITPALGGPPADNCPNEQLRAENNSLALPDCRAYELVSTNSNHSSISAAGLAAPGGDKMVYIANDAPANAMSGLGGINFVLSQRDRGSGWADAELSPPLTAPVTGYSSTFARGISADLSTTFFGSDQQPGPEPVPPGMNFFLRHQDGTYTMVNEIPGPYDPFGRIYAPGALLGGTPDFSHIYFITSVTQFPGDPAENFYEWSAESGLALAGILPSNLPAPDGVNFIGNSDDGRNVAFVTDGHLYVRIDASLTVEAGDVFLEAGNVNLSDQAFLPPEGGKALFTDGTPQTPDANTAGKDLYSYDIATKTLTDLTVDNNPADVLTGAAVKRVVSVSPDGSYIYFVARGNLAAGATSGQDSLYLWHNGKVTFVARGDGLFNESGVLRGTYVTPDGQHLAFLSTDRLTGYDNSDPVTGLPHTEVYVATNGGDILCVSCRPDGSPPRGDATLAGVPGSTIIGGGAPARVVSDNGERVFFQSTDAVTPTASNGLIKVFEYANGRPSIISRPNSPTEAILLGASASGNDVFFRTSGDELVPNPRGGDSAVYDARVGGGFPVPLDGCALHACPARQSEEPSVVMPASSSLRGGPEPQKTKTCPKGKARNKKKKCVKKIRHKHANHANGRKTHRPRRQTGGKS
jgi:WD40-like Beta Propeller Repeat